MGRFCKAVSTVLAGIVLLTGTAVGLAGVAAAQPTISTLSDNSSFAGDFEVPVNKSQILKVDRPFKDILVGNPKIADVLPLTNRTLYILGKELGTTSLSIYGANKSLLAIVDLVVTHNVDGLKAKIFELFPDEKIEVRTVNDFIVLSGTVSSSAHLQSVVALAERYAPGKVTNMMSVTGSQQVMLAVRFAEVKRSAFKELGINLNTLVRSGSTTFSLLSGLPVLGGLGGGGFLNGGTTLAGTAYKGDFVGFLDALEQKGVVKTLAEPNLIALSGDTASFLAGGEFPIPVAQNTSGGGSTITVEFKQFGVSLAFTPTVLADGLDQPRRRARGERDRPGREHHDQRPSHSGPHVPARAHDDRAARRTGLCDRRSAPERVQGQHRPAALCRGRAGAGRAVPQFRLSP